MTTVTNANIRSFAEQLSDIFMRQQDLKIEADAIIDAAKEAGFGPSDIKALRKLAREMITEPAKLAKQYALEEQLDMFRAQVGIFKRKGLVDHQEAA